MAGEPPINISSGGRTYTLTDRIPLGGDPFLNRLAFRGIMSALQTAAWFEAIEEEMPEFISRGLMAGALIVQQEAKSSLGTYQDGWPALADSTQESREMLGYPADEPLLRSGELRDSIGVEVDGESAQVGSNLEYAEYMEEGTSKAPPRPFLIPAFERRGQEVADAVGEPVFAALGGTKDK